MREGRGWKGVERRVGRRREEREEERRGKNDLTHPLSQIPGYATGNRRQEVNYTEMRGNYYPLEHGTSTQESVDTA